MENLNTQINLHENAPVVKEIKRRKTKPKHVYPDGKYKCSICHEIKDVSEFNKQAKAQNGLKYYCKECDKKKNHERYLKEKPRARYRAIKWQHEHAKEFKDYKDYYFFLHPEKKQGKNKSVIKKNPPIDKNIKKMVSAAHEEEKIQELMQEYFGHRE